MACPSRHKWHPWRRRLGHISLAGCRPTPDTWRRSGYAKYDDIPDRNQAPAPRKCEYIRLWYIRGSKCNLYLDMARIQSCFRMWAGLPARRFWYSCICASSITQLWPIFTAVISPAAIIARSRRVLISRYAAASVVPIKVGTLLPFPGVLAI